MSSARRLERHCYSDPMTAMWKLRSVGHCFSFFRIDRARGFAFWADIGVLFVLAICRFDQKKNPITQPQIRTSVNQYKTMPAAASRMHLSHLTGPDMPSASSNAIDPLLTKAIEDAPKTRLIWLLNKLVQCNEHAAALAQTLMLTNENAVVKKRCADEDVGPAAKKCKRYELCAKCDEEFDVLLNTDRSCYWHPGKHTRTKARNM